jgi:hypothetical protein
MSGRRHVSGRSLCLSGAKYIGSSAWRWVATIGVATRLVLGADRIELLRRGAGAVETGRSRKPRRRVSARPASALRPGFCDFWPLGWSAGSGPSRRGPVPIRVASEAGLPGAEITPPGSDPLPRMRGWRDLSRRDIGVGCLYERSYQSPSNNPSANTASDTPARTSTSTASLDYRSWNYISQAPSRLAARQMLISGIIEGVWCCLTRPSARPTQDLG